MSAVSGVQPVPAEGWGPPGGQWGSPGGPWGEPGAAQGAYQQQFWGDPSQGLDPAGHARYLEIISRPIGKTLPRCLLGAAVVNVLVYMFSLVGWVLSLVGCFIGIAIVRAVVFGSGDELDDQRWHNYWLGDIVGYYVTQVALLALFVGTSSFSLVGTAANEGIGAIFASRIMYFLVACAGGMAAGIFNLHRTDDDSKHRAASGFRAVAAQSGRR